MTHNQLSPSGNPLCDGDHCTHPSGKVRIIKIDDSENAHLCRVCHAVMVEDGLPDVAFNIYPSLLPGKPPVTRPATGESI